MTPTTRNEYYEQMIVERAQLQARIHRARQFLASDLFRETMNAREVALLMEYSMLLTELFHVLGALQALYEARLPAGNIKA